MPTHPPNTSAVEPRLSGIDGTKRNTTTIFTDVSAPKGPRAMHKLTRFFSRDHRNTHGYWAKYLFDLHTCSRPVFRSCPKRSLQSPPFLSHPPPLSDRNPNPAALLRMRANYFRPYLSFSACAIEVQHSNENSTTIFIAVLHLYGTRGETKIWAKIISYPSTNCRK